MVDSAPRLKERELLDLSQQTISVLRVFISELRPPLDSPGRPQCVLFLTLAEQHEATTRLAQVGLTTHASVHVRAMLEGLADLHLLGICRKHLRRMQYDQAKGEKRLYERMLEAKELPSSDRLMLEGRLQTCLARYKPLHHEFRADNPSQAEAFNRAGLGDLTGPYSMLCSFAHNDLSALAYRHQGDHSLTYREPVEFETTYLLLSLASFVILKAVCALEGIAYFPHGRFEHHLTELDRLYEAIRALGSPPLTLSKSFDLS